MLLSGLLPVLSHGQSGLGDTTLIEEVRIQENRFQIPFQEYNRNLQVISQRELQALPVRSAQEALRYVAGVDIRQRGPFGTQTDIGIDGGSFEQAVVLINGMKLSDPQTAHHMLNLPVPLEAIERIEILRGPAARVYGVNSLTGAVNIVTKEVKQDALMAHVYSGSSFQSVEEPDKRGVYHGTGLQLGGTLYQPGHQHQIYVGSERSNGHRYNTASESRQIFYQNQVLLDSSNRVQLMAGYLDNRFGANGYYAAPGDKESEEWVGTFISSIASHHQLGRNWYVSPRVSYRYNQDDYRYFRHDLATARSKHYTHVLAGELHAIRQNAIGDFGFGIEGRRESIASSNIGHHSRSNMGVFTEYRSGLWRRVSFNLGMYANYNTDYKWQFYPGADISVRIASKWKLAVSTGSAQRIPSFTDLYLDQRPGNIGNPSLESERAWQHELNAVFQHRELRIQAGYFHRDIRNFIDWVRAHSDLPFEAQNLGENRVNGLHGSVTSALAFDAGGRLSGQLSYTYLDASLLRHEKTAQIKYGINHLKHQLIGRVGFSKKGWQALVAGRLLQRQSDHQYFVADARLSYRWARWQIYGDIQNIFDEQYLEIGAVPMLGRWANFGLTYRWSRR